MFEINCPVCDHLLELPESAIEQKVRCTRCRSKFIIHEDTTVEILEDLVNAPPPALEKIRMGETEPETNEVQGHVSVESETVADEEDDDTPYYALKPHQEASVELDITQEDEPEAETDEEETEPSLELPPVAPPKSTRFFKTIFILLLLCVLGGGTYYAYTHQELVSKEFNSLKTQYLKDFLPATADTQSKTTQQKQGQLSREGNAPGEHSPVDPNGNTPGTAVSSETNLDKGSPTTSASSSTSATGNKPKRAVWIRNGETKTADDFRTQAPKTIEGSAFGKVASNDQTVKPSSESLPNPPPTQPQKPTPNPKPEKTIASGNLSTVPLPESFAEDREEVRAQLQKINPATVTEIPPGSELASLILKNKFYDAIELETLEKIKLSRQGLMFLGHFLSDDKNLSDFFGSGDTLNADNALLSLHAIFANDETKSCATMAVLRNLAYACALSLSDGKYDAVQFYKTCLQYRTEGKLHPQFEEMSIGEMRWVIQTSKAEIFKNKNPYIRIFGNPAPAVLPYLKAMYGSPNYPKSEYFVWLAQHFIHMKSIPFVEFTPKTCEVFPYTANTGIPNFGKQKPSLTFENPLFTIENVTGGKYTLVFTGKARCIKSGEYQITLKSENKAQLIIRKKVAVEITHPETEKSKTGEVRFLKGETPFTAYFFYAGKGKNFTISSESQTPEFDPEIEKLFNMALTLDPTNFDAWNAYGKYCSKSRESSSEQWLAWAAPVCKAFQNYEVAAWALINGYPVPEISNNEGKNFLVQFYGMCHKALPESENARNANYAFESVLNEQAAYLSTTTKVNLKFFAMLMDAHRASKNNIMSTVNWGAHRFIQKEKVEKEYIEALKTFVESLSDAEKKTFKDILTVPMQEAFKCTDNAPFKTLSALNETLNP